MTHEDASQTMRKYHNTKWYDFSEELQRTIFSRKSPERFRQNSQKQVAAHYPLPFICTTEAAPLYPEPPDYLLQALQQHFLHLCNLTLK